MSQRLPGTLAVLLEADLDVASQVRWAARLAAARGLDLRILQQVEGRDERVVEVPLDEAPEGEDADVVREIRNVIEASSDLRAGLREAGEASDLKEKGGPCVVHVRLARIHFASLPSLRRAVLAELGRSEIELFTLARRQLLDMSDAELVRESRLFLRYIPCQVVLCHGLDVETPPSRILVAAAGGPNGLAALQLGRDLAMQANGTVTALHVNPDIGLDAERVGERRLSRLLERTSLARDPALVRRVVVDDHVHGGVRRVWEEEHHDLVVVGGPRAQIDGSLGTKLGKDVTVAIVSAASPFTNRFKRGSQLDEVVAETRRRRASAATR